MCCQFIYFQYFLSEGAAHFLKKKKKTHSTEKTKDEKQSTWIALPVPGAVMSERATLSNPPRIQPQTPFGYLVSRKLALLQVLVVFFWKTLMLQEWIEKPPALIQVFPLSEIRAVWLDQSGGIPSFLLLNGCPMYGWIFGCFRCEAIMNKALLNIHIQSLCERISLG